MFSPGEFHGQGAGYSPQGHKELDTTERLTHTQTLKLEQALFFFPSKQLFSLSTDESQSGNPHFTDDILSFVSGLVPHLPAMGEKEGKFLSPHKGRRG